MLAKPSAGRFEEPLVPDAIDDFVALRQRAHLPIAGGEVLTRRQAFLPFLVRGAFDIVHPDVTKVGGFSEQRRVAWMATEFCVRCVGHDRNTALGVATELQLVAAQPGADLVEFIGGSAYLDGLLAAPFRLDARGMLEIPSRPGLEIAPDRDRLSPYTPDPDFLFTPLGPRPCRLICRATAATSLVNASPGTTAPPGHSGSTFPGAGSSASTRKAARFSPRRRGRSFPPRSGSAATEGTLSG